MTFPELVLSSRGRLWDIRARDGSLITDASKDGIRYPASEMLNICKGALLEMLRAFRALDLKELVDEATTYRKSGAVIKNGTGVVEIDGAFTNIVGLRGQNPKHIYDYQAPDLFYSRYYDVLNHNDSTELEERIYTILWDAENKSKEVLSLPVPTADINGQVIVRQIYTDLMTLDSPDELPLYDVDDILWDFIEREARAREHSTAMVKLLTEKINYKLSELKVGVQRTT